MQAAAATARNTDQTVNRQNLARQVAHLIRLIRGGARVINGTDWWHDPHYVEESRHACCDD